MQYDLPESFQTDADHAALRQPEAIEVAFHGAQLASAKAEVALAQSQMEAQSFRGVSSASSSKRFVLCAAGLVCGAPRGGGAS
eukprot:3921554-Pyramimonas_sp.AAC.1